MDLAVMLRVHGRRAVVVGGGETGARRAAALAGAGAEVTVIAPEVDERIGAMGDRVRIERRGYERGDLAGAWLVVTATNSAEVNERAAAEAAERGALVNRADRPEAGDLTVPAQGRVGPVTVAVSAGGISARAAAVMRDQMIGALDRDWRLLLETVAPFRRELRERVEAAERRREALHRLTDPEAMNLLKAEGADALRHRCEAIVERAAMSHQPPATSHRETRDEEPGARNSERGMWDVGQR